MSLKGSERMVVYVKPVHDKFHQPLFCLSDIMLFKFKHAALEVKSYIYIPDKENPSS